jgi:hypothetical protein
MCAFATECYSKGVDTSWQLLQQEPLHVKQRDSGVYLFLMHVAVWVQQALLSCRLPPANSGIGSILGLLDECKSSSSTLEEKHAETAGDSQAYKGRGRSGNERAGAQLHGPCHRGGQVRLLCLQLSFQYD